MMFGWTCVSAHADQAAVEDAASTSPEAMKLSAKGYEIAPVAAGLLGNGQVFEVMIPVQSGHDYAVLVVKDAYAIDMSLYVVSESGSILNPDYRSGVSSRQAAQIRCDCSGEARTYVTMETNELGGYAVLVGQRGPYQPSGGPNP